jgi:hypothetical protein
MPAGHGCALTQDSLLDGRRAFSGPTTIAPGMMASRFPPRSGRKIRALVLLATFASLRWGEVTAVHRRDLDTTIGTVRIRTAFT